MFHYYHFYIVYRCISRTTTILDFIVALSSMDTGLRNYSA